MVLQHKEALKIPFSEAQAYGFLEEAERELFISKGYWLRSLMDGSLPPMNDSQQKLIRSDYSQENPPIQGTPKLDRYARIWWKYIKNRSGPPE